MRVGKRPVETIKDGNENCDRTGRNEIEKIGGNGHDTLLSIGCVSTRPAHHRRGSGGSLCRPCSWLLPRREPAPPSAEFYVRQDSDWSQKMFKIIFCAIFICDWRRWTSCLIR